jgi:hypothetical protein
MTNGRYSRRHHAGWCVLGTLILTNCAEGRFEGGGCFGDQCNESTGGKLNARGANPTEAVKTEAAHPETGGTTVGGSSVRIIVDFPPNGGSPELNCGGVTNGGGTDEGSVSGERSSGGTSTESACSLPTPAS